MSKFTLTISTDSAAFDDPAELARILRREADKLEEGHVVGHCIDVNGNVCGEWEKELREADVEPCDDDT